MWEAKATSLMPLPEKWTPSLPRQGDVSMVKQIIAGGISCNTRNSTLHVLLVTNYRTIKRYGKGVNALV
jgi:hypothetical protein